MKEKPMLERFTEPARKVMALANQEVARLGHEYIGAEHILLGLTCCDGAIGLTILKNLGVNVEHLRTRIEEVLRESPALPAANDHRISGAKKVIESAIREAASQQRQFVGTAHLLLGLVREDKTATGRLLKEIGVTPEVVRTEATHLAQTGAGDEPPPLPRKWPPIPELRT
jgi:ATP-dependent Clp protease ATP-binding subunit ClpC